MKRSTRAQRVERLAWALAFGDYAVRRAWTTAARFECMPRAAQTRLRMQATILLNNMQKSGLVVRRRGEP